jgi:hypothetical protein
VDGKCLFFSGCEKGGEGNCPFDGIQLVSFFLSLCCFVAYITMASGATDFQGKCTPIEWKVIQQFNNAQQSWGSDVKHHLLTSNAEGVKVLPRDSNEIKWENVDREDVLILLQYVKTLYWYASHVAIQESQVLPSCMFEKAEDAKKKEDATARATRIAKVKYAERVAAVLELGVTKNEVEEQTSQLHAMWNLARAPGAPLSDELFTK